jgi:hypothetical protein
MDPRNRFLLSGVVAAAVTGSAWRPVDRSAATPGSPLQFLSGVPTSEMPLPTLGLQAVVGLAAARGGGMRGLRGTLGLGLTAASFAALVALQREAGRSDDVLEQALQEGLGCPASGRAAATPPPATCRTATTGATTDSTYGAVPTCPPTPGPRCWCRCTAARG